jgi:hypothetical protein
MLKGFMEKIYFADNWQQILAKNGLKSFNDCYHKDNKVYVNRNHRRNVSLIRLKTDNGEKKFYLKRFRHSHLKDILFTFLNTGKFMSQAAYEWSNIKLLAKHNIGVPTCVCYGEEIRLGLERKSFLITEELPMQCFAQFITNNWQSLAQNEKEKIVTSLAKTIKKIHKIGISLPDLYVWHIYIEKKENGDYHFAFLDFNRMKRNAYGQNERIENLGRLHYSMKENYFDKSLRLLFLETYAEKMKAKDLQALIRRVKRYSKKYKARKTPKPY